MEGDTKNHTNPTVAVPEFLAKLLKTELEGKATTALVFPSARGGGYLTLGQARYSFQKATASVEGYKGLLGDQVGGHVKVVQKLLGHKKAVMTQDQYGHLYQDDLDAVANALDAAAKTTTDTLRTSGPRNAIRPPRKGA